MEFQGKVIVITGSASGIGLALARRFVQEGATVIGADRNEEVGQAQAAEIGARFVTADVSREEGVKALIDDVLAREGHIDLFCSNAGIGLGEGPESPDKVWDLVYRVNVMSHVWAARHLLPHFRARGGGHLLNTASAAGLLTELHSAPYAVTKHGALALAEWLAITYGGEGVKVACLCPEGVWTPMIENAPLLQKTAISTDELVEATLEVLRRDGFLITTHDTTLQSFRAKAADYDAWVSKMGHLRAKAMRLLAEQRSGATDTAPMRRGEELPLDKLKLALQGKLAGDLDHLSAEQFPGGFSNLTYLLRLGDQQYVLRRAPLGPVAKGAHDMTREYHLLEKISAVLPAAPRVIALIEDTDVLGSPFYLMERRRGVVVRDRLPGEYAGNPEAPRQLSLALAGTLADLHAVNISAAGLREIGKPEGFNRRQVEGWARRWRRARDLLADSGDLPPPAELLDELVIAWLETQTPPETAHTLVHNDFKLDNLMFDPADPSKVTALLDWEMTTLGDPLVDVGLTLTYWTMPTQPGGAPNRIGAPAADQGFLTREEWLAHYAAASGRDVSNILWYEVLGHFKLAVIVLQIFARYRLGQTQDERFAPLGQQATWLIQEAWRRIAAQGAAGKADE